MSTQISRMYDVSGVGVDFETGTMCGSVAVGEKNGTRKMFTITPWYSDMIVIPRNQALIVANQIAHQFGYKVVKQ